MYYKLELHQHNWLIATCLKLLTFCDSFFPLLYCLISVSDIYPSGLFFYASFATSDSSSYTVYDIVIHRITFDACTQVVRERGQMALPPISCTCHRSVKYNSSTLYTKPRTWIINPYGIFMLTYETHTTQSSYNTTCYIICGYCYWNRKMREWMTPLKIRFVGLK